MTETITITRKALAFKIPQELADDLRVLCDDERLRAEIEAIEVRRLAAQLDDEFVRDADA